jgi:hypothetical protein
VSPPAQTFTQESARSLPLTGALCGVIAVETAALHLLLWTWHPWLAWTLTALSLWTIVWLIGDYRAIGARPVVLEADALLVRLGRRFHAGGPAAGSAGGASAQPTIGRLEKSLRHG